MFKKRELGTFAAGVVLAGSVVFGAVAIDTSGPTKSAGYADPGSPVACADATCGTPVALPTIEPTTQPVEAIEAMPLTGGR